MHVYSVQAVQAQMGLIQMENQFSQQLHLEDKLSTGYTGTTSQTSHGKGRS